MEKKVIFVISIFIGVFFAMFLTKVKVKKTEDTACKEDSLVVVTCIGEMDSATLRQEQDSVVRFGNKLCSENLYYYYTHFNCGLYDIAFYSMIMVNKYDDIDSYGCIFDLQDELAEKININGFMGKMINYYLVQGAKRGDWNSCSQLEHFYEEGILFQKDEKKAMYYKKKKDKIDEIKWIK